MGSPQPCHTDVMALSRKLLGANERVIFHVRTHWKVLIVPAIVGLLAIAIGAVGTIFLSQNPGPWAVLVLWILAAAVFVVWSFLPWLRWLTTTYTITDRRIITRRGILNKTGHDLPLSRIANVQYEISLSDRVLHCGTLILETAADDPLALHDIPDVEQVHVTMTELLFGGRGAAGAGQPD